MLVVSASLALAGVAAAGTVTVVGVGVVASAAALLLIVIFACGLQRVVADALNPTSRDVGPHYPQESPGVDDKVAEETVESAGVVPVERLQRIIELICRSRRSAPRGLTVKPRVIGCIRSIPSAGPAEPSYACVPRAVPLVAF